MPRRGGRWNRIDEPPTQQEMLRQWAREQKKHDGLPVLLESPPHEPDETDYFLTPGHAADTSRAHEVLVIADGRLVSAASAYERGAHESAHRERQIAQQVTGYSGQNVGYAGEVTGIAGSVAGSAQVDSEIRVPDLTEEEWQENLGRVTAEILGANDDGRQTIDRARPLGRPVHEATHSSPVPADPEPLHPELDTAERVDRGLSFARWCGWLIPQGFIEDAKGDLMEAAAHGLAGADLDAAIASWKEALPKLAIKWLLRFLFSWNRRAK